MAMTPMRASEGYDFTPILTHYVFLLTSILAIAGWFIAFIGQIVTQADQREIAHATVGVLWFAIFLQLAFILGVLHTLATDSVALHRFQISVFGAVAIVFSVFGVNQGIFTNFAPLEAMAAGWLLLSIVNILWVLYFTSEENSLSLHLFNSFGTGGLTGPGRNGFRSGGRRTTGSHANMPNGPGGGYTIGIGGGPDYGSPAMGGGISGGMGGGYDTKEPTMGGIGGVDGGQMGVSQRSLGGGGGSVHSSGGGAMGPMSGTTSPPAATPTMGVGSMAADMPNPSTPLMASGNPGSGDGPSIPDTYLYRAKALYAYNASPDDPNEISFSKGEILDIVDKTGKWWQAKRVDGASGIAPSNYLQII